MTPEEETQAEEARKYVRAHRRLLVSTFADSSTHKKAERPVSIFMAGSPGAGKTEFSKRIIEALFQEPGDNSHVFQGASARGVEILYDHILAHNLNVVLDGTFALKEKGFSNVERSLSHDRLVEIYYLFQEPEVAWDFTKKREVLEHRRITKEVFIRAFFAAHENVAEAKARFGDKIRLNLVLKDIRDPSTYRMGLNATGVDQLIPWTYSHDTLTETLQ